MSLTSRVSAFFLIALALVLAGFSGALFVLASNYLVRQLDERLVNALVKYGKLFQFMSYPNRSHGIFEGDGTRAHPRSSARRWFDARMAARASWVEGDCTGIEHRKPHAPKRSRARSRSRYNFDAFEGTRSGLDATLER